ncbi:hypothetical protein K1719_011252 [Acacia pycnantha]|nr:hypothetical protein K1719_011252 [Acacia pycnantha]
MKKPAPIVVGVPLFIHRRLLIKKEYLGQQSYIFPGHLENDVGNEGIRDLNETGSLKVCKKPGHEAGFKGATYIDCPMKPCYLCKMPDYKRSHRDAQTLSCHYRFHVSCLFTAAPVLVCVYICHYNVHNIDNELEDSSQMRGVVRSSLILCSSVYIMTSFFGFLLFGELPFPQKSS